jgi:alpha-D-xyloside xylohydrolase
MPYGEVTVKSGKLFGALTYFAGLLSLACCHPLFAQEPNVVLEHDGVTVMLAPYAPNIIRVTLSTLKDEATGAPGYGFTAVPSNEGWKHESTDTADTFSSSRMTVTVPADRHKGKRPVDPMCDTCKFFSGSVPYVGLKITAPDGSTILNMQGWEMSVPNHKDGNADILNDRRPTDPAFYRVGATFASPADEHYYGLGQTQEGYLDRRGHTTYGQHDYLAAGGPSVCVPFMVTNKGYGILWDNPSQTKIEPGFNEQTKWISEVGRRVSYFVILGKTTDEIYEGYRLLTGSTPMLPKAAYGFIQCKQRYRTQAEVLAVAKGYRERHLPADMLVVDWFYYTRMGQMDFKPEDWPDPAAMNKQLHDMGFETMISVWPRFTPDSRFYDFILKKGWFEHTADGTPLNGLPYDKAGSDIDTTDPAAGRWYWDTIRDNILSKGFDALWADETEPDLPPTGAYFHIGPGTEYFNTYPLFHTAALYDGYRRDTKHRALILSRDAYLGMQHNGAIMWSSDIYPTWDTLKRQIPTGLDFTASGIPYWGNDIGGWQGLPYMHKPAKTPLIDPSDARDNVMHDDDYPELYVRWFEYGAFEPNFRTHGTRRYNEVWSYGKQAEPILEKYLKLRYQLMPYIYSLGYMTHQTGAPYMRALFMDFPNDPKVADIGDEYMFGPAFLVAPVTDQGETTRTVYLPAGTDWFNYWTSERVHGGQMIEAQAPIDTLPLFVKAGSIIPMGAPVESTHEMQKISELRVYPGAEASFTLYNDDGVSYDYEKGEQRVTVLKWDDHSGKFSSSGAKAWEGSTQDLVKVVGK